MSSDSVTTAFDLILEEIASVVSEVNSQGAAFLRSNDHAKARASIQTSEQLAAFSHKLETLKQEWVSGLDEPTRQQVKVETSAVSRAIASGPKSAKTVLVVKFNDGTVIYESVAAVSFAMAIKKLGFQRVIGLGINVNKFPLVSRQHSDNYTQTAIDGYLVMTHSSTESKREQLQTIAAELREHLTVDIVSA